MWWVYVTRIFQYHECAFSDICLQTAVTLSYTEKKFNLQDTWSKLKKCLWYFHPTRGQKQPITSSLAMSIPH